MACRSAGWLASGTVPEGGARMRRHAASTGIWLTRYYSAYVLGVVHACSRSRAGSNTRVRALACRQPACAEDHSSEPSRGSSLRVSLNYAADAGAAPIHSFFSCCLVLTVHLQPTFRSGSTYPPSKRAHHSSRCVPSIRLAQRPRRAHQVRSLRAAASGVCRRSASTT